MTAAAVPRPNLRIPSAVRFPLFIAAVAFVSWTLLRLLLWFNFKPADTSAADILKTFAAGLHIDAALALVAPVILIGFSAFFTTLVFIIIGPLKLAVPQFRSFPLWKVLFRVAVTVGFIAGIFLLISEWYFFDEFDSRFNTVAIDYLLYTHEVFTNIWESYPVSGIIAACCIGGGLLSWVAFRYFSPAETKSPARKMIAVVICWPIVAMAAFISVRPAETSFSVQRVVNELANNGWASAIRAAWTRNLDFSAFYVTMARDEAFRRARKLLVEPGVVFVGPEVPDAPKPDSEGRIDKTANAQWLDAARLSLTRQIPGDPSRPRRNVCILLEESFGSEFWGALGCVDKDGKPHTLTPEMDRMAAEEGMLFTSILADGNRTIRGFEGVFSSFPPLPGDSILARDKTDRVETIARVLKRDGYQSLFLYGGRGTFDYIKSYTQSNGWDRLVEQKDFEDPVHTTAWGVSDEDLFHRGIEEMRNLHQTGQPFLVSFMTVSNHKPYTYPKGRIPEDPDVRLRTHAVKYADWALGDFFRRAKAEPFWNDTIFIVVGDHGARVYGSQTIPLQSYRVPFLVAGPCVVDKPQRVDTPGCQLDVAPTILGLIGRPYTSLFFGHNLLLPGAAERNKSLMHHNRSIAIYRDGRQVVYGLNKTLEYWHGDAGKGTMVGVPRDESFDILQKDGTALFVCADELYVNYRFILAD
ncbi:MAG TPA: LTA synthase family protein [Verrucomicrobiales bacterium]|nr:LTA synthase family protein [Verrucomicrobiales bacterium]